jgi:hypothetical protein
MEPDTIPFGDLGSVYRPTWLDLRDDTNYWKGFSLMFRVASSNSQNNVVPNPHILGKELSDIDGNRTQLVGQGEEMGLYIAGIDEAKRLHPVLEAYDIAGDGKTILAMTFEAIRHTINKDL